MLHDECPDVFLGPTQEGIDFDEAELGIPLYHAGDGALTRLVATDRADPGLVANHGPSQRQDLTVEAALVRSNAIQRTAVLRFVFGHVHFGANILDLNAVAVLDALAQFQRLRNLVTRLEIEATDTRLDL